MPIVLTESTEMARLLEDGSLNTSVAVDDTGLHDLGDLWRDLGGSD